MVGRAPSGASNSTDAQRVLYRASAGISRVKANLPHADWACRRARLTVLPRVLFAIPVSTNMVAPATRGTETALL